MLRSSTSCLQRLMWLQPSFCRAADLESLLRSDPACMAEAWTCLALPCDLFTRITGQITVGCFKPPSASAVAL